jgi:hypothetical protein
MTGGGHTLFTTAGAGPTLAPLIAGHLSAAGIGPTLLMIPGITHLMTVTVGGIDTVLSLEACHLGQGGSQGGATHVVSRPGQGGARGGVTHAAFCLDRGVPGGVILAAFPLDLGARGALDQGVNTLEATLGVLVRLQVLDQIQGLLVVLARMSEKLLSVPI